MGVIKLFGQEFPEYVECPWCKKENACRFEKVCYNIPCEECKKTEKYLKQKAESDKLSSGPKWSELEKQNNAAGIFTFKGRDIVVNGKGDIISDMKHNPTRTHIKKGVDGSYK